MNAVKFKFLHRGVLILAAGVAIAAQSGCVVFELRDELVKTNASLTRNEKSLEQTNQGLAMVQQSLADLKETNALLTRNALSLEQANRDLANIHQSMAELMETNRQLDEMNKRLATTNGIVSLEAMAASLALDAHMASLRKTIENIDKRMPFVKFSADEPGVAVPPQPATQPASGGKK